MNSVNLIGRLTRDPELRWTGSGTAVASFTLAVDGAGDRQDDGTYAAGFFDITVWDKQAENCAQYLAKGRQAGVSGRLLLHKWETQEGAKRSKVEITAQRVDFLGGREDGDGARHERDEPAGDEDSQVPAGQTTADFFSGADDDIPF